MKKVLAIFFALLLMTSHSGVVFATHYCMGEIADISVGFATEAEPCEMAKKPKSCEGDALKKMNCCHDDYVQIQLNESYQTTASDVQIHVPFWVAFTCVYFNLCDNDIAQKPEFCAYSPPLIQQDRPILFQSFLI